MRCVLPKKIEIGIYICLRETYEVEIHMAEHTGSIEVYFILLSTYAHELYYMPSTFNSSVPPTTSMRTLLA